MPNEVAMNSCTGSLIFAQAKATIFGYRVMLFCDMILFELAASTRLFIFGLFSGSQFLVGLIIIFITIPQKYIFLLCILFILPLYLESI